MFPKRKMEGNQERERERERERENGRRQKKERRKTEWVKGPVLGCRLVGW